VLSADEVQSKIEQYQDHIEDLVVQIRQAGRQAAESEAEYEMRIAQERLRTRYEANESGVKVTIPVIEDTATVATYQLRLKALLAKNDLSTLREALGAAKTNIDSLRTLAASNRFIP
jgi:hypothetical protein